MSISGIGSTGGHRPVSGGQVHPRPSQVSSPSRLNVPTDEVECSPVARMMAELDNLEQNDPSRAELVARIRQEIEQGTYDTDEKLEAALANFLQQIENEQQS